MQTCSSSSWKYSIAITYERQTGLTIAFIHGLRADEIAELMAQIKASIDDTVVPTLIPTLLLTERLENAIHSNHDSNITIVRNEYDTHVRTEWHTGKACCRSHTKHTTTQHIIDTMDFDAVSRELTSVANKLAYSELVCNLHFPMLDELDELGNVIATAATSRPPRLALTAKRLQDRTRSLRTSFQAALCLAQCLTKRANALNQHVRHPYLYHILFSNNQG